MGRRRANIGAYTLIGASRGADVVALEASYANCGALWKNALVNDLDDRILPLPLFLGSHSSRAALETADHDEARPIVSLRPAIAASRPSRSPLTISSNQFGVPAPTLLKLDVDGGEAAVLVGAKSTLALPTLRSVLVEVAEDRSRTFADFLPRPVSSCASDSIVGTDPHVGDPVRRLRSRLDTYEVAKGFRLR